MTIPNVSSHIDHAGNDVTLQFAMPYYFLLATDLLVTLYDSAGLGTPLIINVEYTVTGAGDPAGGYINVFVAPATDEVLSIIVDPPITQLSHYVQNQPFPSATLEGNLDKLTQICQRLDDQLGRSLVINGTSGPSVTINGPATGGFPLLINGGSSTTSYVEWMTAGYLYGYIGDAAGFITAAAPYDFGMRAENSLILASGGATARVEITPVGDVIIKKDIGLNATPSSWVSGLHVVEGTAGAFYTWDPSTIGIAQNAYLLDGVYWKYKVSGVGAAMYRASSGWHQWFTAPAGVADASIALAESLSIGPLGNIVMNAGSLGGALLTIVGVGTALDVPFGGVVIGAAAGGNMGNGTINATNLYVNGIAVSAGGVTPPGGVDTQIQFNNAGSFGGSSMTYDSAAGAFDIPAASSGAALTIHGGLLVGVPTGGDQGAGTINAESIFVNGVTVGSGSVATVRGLFHRMYLSGGGANDAINYFGDELVLRDRPAFNTGAFDYVTIRQWTGVYNASAVGVNGRDSATALAANTWYSLWAVWNGTTSALMSSADSVITLPAGYTHCTQIGYMRTDSAGVNPLGFYQYGNSVRYTIDSSGNTPSLPIISSGVVGDPATPTWARVNLASVVPPYVKSVSLLALCNGHTILSVSSTTDARYQYGGYASTTNPPPFARASAELSINEVELLPIGGYIDYATDNAADQLRCIGYELGSR
jgi:hypothetical protein